MLMHSSHLRNKRMSAWSAFLAEAMCCGVQVDLTNIGFAYPTRSDIVALEDVTFKLEPGKLVALVGLSGSGKSTLVALLQRLYDPNSGQV